MNECRRNEERQESQLRPNLWGMGFAADQFIQYLSWQWMSRSSEYSLLGPKLSCEMNVHDHEGRFKDAAPFAKL